MLFEVFFIFIAKLTEVILTTMRTMCANKGRRNLVPFVAFVEINMWLLVISRVVVNLKDHPYRMVAYAFGFALGHYIGLMLDERIGLGTVTIQVIISEKEGIELTEKLRDNKIAVTTFTGEGMDDIKKILLIYAPRKNRHDIIDIINEEHGEALITISEVKNSIGGYRIKDR